MYKVKLSEDEKERIAAGNTGILLSKLLQIDQQVVKELKQDKSGNVSFLQGISHIVDELITILQRNTRA